MNTRFRTGIVLIAVLALCGPPTAAGTDLRDSLQSQRISAARINLNPGGAGLGFETEIAGSVSRLAALLDVIRQARPGGGHKCPNAGAIRFHMQDGSVIGLGLLPSHTAGLYEFRLYDGERLIDAYRVERAALLTALAALGVPTDDYAFRE